MCWRVARWCSRVRGCFLPDRGDLGKRGRKKIYLSEIVGNKEFRAVDSAGGPDFTFLLKGNVDRVQKMVLVYNSDKRKEIIVDGEPMNVMFEETTKEWKGKPRLR
ncbi:MAG: hypothetical protein ACLU4J_07810 [Butyricimonas paravirosa]